ncbi:hypothetical protein MEO41_27395, partial [Dolichospermum sp. ST_sed4]|nr:hypothetical protein [Dolichospermum sp. ST_sed4]
PSLELDVLKVCIAMFLIGRIIELRQKLAIKNTIGSYSVYCSFRNRVSEMLTGNYYSKSTQAVISDYLDLEPLLSACSEICELPAVNLQDAVSIHKQKLLDELRALGKKT